MELVKAGRSRQVINKTDIRLSWIEGRRLCTGRMETEGRIVLTPVAVINKERAKPDFFS